ncbi:MAG TPA: hypothetical protein VF230_01190 [Acidimicrobiales bacterium]
MPVPTSGVAWWGSLLWLAAVTVAAFGVAWVTGTRLHVRRAAYIPILLIVTAALWIGYVDWLGLDVGDAATNRWDWGVAGGLVAGFALAAAVRTQPVDRHVARRELPLTLAWEGVVYGIGEGMLLAGLPAFVAWQMVHSLGWGGFPGALARWTLPVVAAAVVIVTHHLGYWHCRGRILLPITLACSVLTIAYLLTGSFVAPVVGHVVMHFGAVLHGVEMPPVDRPARGTGARGRRPARLAA